MGTQGQEKQMSIVEMKKKLINSNSSRESFYCIERKDFMHVQHVDEGAKGNQHKNYYNAKHSAFNEFIGQQFKQKFKI